jgi:hypothetical protein
MNDRMYTIHPVTATSEHELLILGDNLRLEPDVLLGSAIFGSGMPGSGKTSLFVRLLEEFSRFNIPLCTFDIEGDIASATQMFPRGFIATSTNTPTPKDVIELGLQVVADLSTWPDMEARASYVARMTQGLFSRMDSLPFNRRCPVLVALDEAQMWLPQRRGETFSPEAYKALSEAFHALATRGRKRGLVPLLFCQKISEVAKTVLSPGTYFLLKQSVTVDQKRYLEILDKTDTLAFMSEKQIMQYIGSLPPGKAFVKLATGEQRIVQLYERSSQHISHTPKAVAAMNRYSAQPFSPDMRFGADIEVEPAPAAKQVPIILKRDDTPVTQAKQTCEKCKAPATHQLAYNVLRATAKGKVTEERSKYFCTEHANRQCKLMR